MTCIRCQHQACKRFGTYGKRRIQRWRCNACKATFSEPQPQSSLGAMRTSEEAAIRAVKCLIEGCSIRSTERLTGLNRNTIMRLLVVAGERCALLMDAKMRNLSCKSVESDELWCFVMKKRGHVRQDDPEEWGDQWIFVAEDAYTKLIPSFVVGKRTNETTQAFISDLKSRLSHRTQLTTDGFHFYIDAVEEAFGTDVDFAQLVKLYGDYGQRDAAARYSPGTILEVISKVRQGNPNPYRISTSYVERQNLTVRMGMRRLTRLTNAFSKKLSHLKAAVALHFAYYNFCRVHSTLRVTPAVEAGLTDHVWSVAELLRAA